MLISDILTPERVHCDVRSSSKKRLLEKISRDLAQNGSEADSREIFEALIARERLGSTGLGHGVAIPHGRVRGSRHVEASFFRLHNPLPFDSPDSQPVDLLFAIVVPEDASEDHLNLLAQVAGLFSDEELLGRLRAAECPSEVLQMLTRPAAA